MSVTALEETGGRRQEAGEAGRLRRLPQQPALSAMRHIKMQASRHRSLTPRLVALLPLVFISWTQPVLAQPGGDTEQVDAIRCWRRVGRNAIHVGERFTMTVTCSVVESDDARTLPDQAALEPETIDVAPFEVLGGEHYEDIRSGAYRFFQYHYTLRVISESHFGEDVEIPPLHITYRIERRVGDNPALLGRELTYVLPPEPIRVVSLVPDAIVDIRDVPPATFGTAQARVFRSTLLTLLAALFGVVAVGVVALGAVRIARERRGGAARVDRRLPLPLIANRALGELTLVQQATAEAGWSGESAGRALAALRVAGSVAVAGSVTQSLVPPGTPARDGQLRLRHGVLRPKTAVISSGLTAPALTRRLEHTGAGRTGRADSNVAGDLGRAMTLFTAARYGRNGSLPTDELTREIDISIAHLKRLRWRSAAPVRHVSELMAAADDWWKTVRTR